MVIAVSILAAVVLGLGVYLLNRIDHLQNTVREEVLPKLSGLPDFTSQAETIASVETSLKHLEKSIGNLDSRMETLQEQVAAISSGGRIVKEEGTTGSQSQ